MNFAVLFAQKQNLDAPDLSSMIAVVVVFQVLFYVFFSVCLMKIFTKAGEPGWAGFVPIYNAIIMVKVAGKPIWWFVLLLVPCINIIIIILLGINLAKNFRQSALFGLGLVLPPFYLICLPILAFGSAVFDPVEMDGQPVQGGRRRADDDDRSR